MKNQFVQETERMPLNYDWVSLDKNLKHLAVFIKKRLRQDWDLVICLSGEEGCGKSTLGILLGAIVDKKFNLKDNVAFLPDAKEIVREYTKLKKYQCYVIDEAIRSLYKMTFMTTMTQTLVRMWATERYQNKCTILILPRFKDLTENFRNHRVKLWIHVISRGVAVVYTRDDDPHTKDPWNFDFAYKYKLKTGRKQPIATMSLERRLYIESRMKNYLFHFNFPDLPEDFKKVYQSQKIQSRDEMNKQEEQDKIKKNPKLTDMTSQRNKLIFKMITELKVSRKEIMEQFTLSRQQVTRILKKEEKNVKEKEFEKQTEEQMIGVDRYLDTALKIEEQKAKIK